MPIFTTSVTLWRLTALEYIGGARNTQAHAYIHHIGMLASTFWRSTAALNSRRRTRPPRIHTGGGACLYFIGSRLYARVVW